MKLVYWVSDELNGERAYNIRRKTKKAVKAEMATYGDQAEKLYGKPYKVTVEYDDAFDLVCKALGESGIEYER
jgi:hypothetical protein